MFKHVLNLLIDENLRSLWWNSYSRIMTGDPSGMGEMTVIIERRYGKGGSFVGTKTDMTERLQHH